MNRSSWAMCEAVRAVSPECLGRHIGTADSVTVDAITDRLVFWLGHRI